MSSLLNKQILVGITGGIAAYKTGELIRLLTKAGADVQVVTNEGAKAFVTEMTLQAVSGHPVRSSLSTRRQNLVWDILNWQNGRMRF